MNTSTNQTIKERQQQRSLQAPTAVMKLTDSILNVGSTNISAIITSTPIGLIADQLQDNDKYTPPTIKPPDYIPSLRNPPLAPKRQNTRNVYDRKDLKKKLFFFIICLFFFEDNNMDLTIQLHPDQQQHFYIDMNLHQHHLVIHEKRLVHEK